VLIRNSYTLRRLAFEIELDQHCRLIPDHTAIVSGFDDYYLRCGKVQRATVREGHVDPSTRQETHMRVHARLGANSRLDVFCPVKAHWINGALYTSIPGAHNVESHSAEYLVLGSGYWSQERIVHSHRHRLRTEFISAKAYRNSSGEAL
jgi:hypothetical protein